LAALGLDSGLVETLAAEEYFSIADLKEASVKALKELGIKQCPAQKIYNRLHAAELGAASAASAGRTVGRPGGQGGQGGRGRGQKHGKARGAASNDTGGEELDSEEAELASGDVSEEEEEEEEDQEEDE
jgi:hypothetical protein